MHRTRKALLTGALAAGLGITATAAVAMSLEPDGVHVEAPFVDGGQAHLELEDRNTRPAICFVWDHPAPHDGDSLASRILTRDGVEVVDLGTGDQWIDGSGEGCEIPTYDRYRDVFTNPSDYIVEFHVVEDQGTPATRPVRSEPLQPASEEPAALSTGAAGGVPAGSGVATVAALVFRLKVRAAAGGGNTMVTAGRQQVPLPWPPSSR